MRPELQNLPEPNWFWHGETLLPIVEGYRPFVCVELGTNRGCSAIATARLLQNWGGHLTCVDTWESEWHGASVTAAEFLQNAQEVQGLISIVQSRNDVAAATWDRPIDYLYIDADHTYDAVTSDLECWWPHLKVGGLIAGDDYDDPNDTEIPPNVTRAWDAFEVRHDQAFMRTPTPGLCSRLIWGIKR